MRKKGKRGQKISSPTESMSHDDTTCDAILVAQAKIRGQEEMERCVRDSIEKAKQEGVLHVESVSEVGIFNPHGGSYAGSTKFVSHIREVVNTQKTSSSSYAVRVSSPEDVHRAYKAIRDRFISVYVRDKLKKPADKDKQFIIRGNEVAHGGDAIFDAQLYQGKGRRADPEVFEELYGFSPEDVLKIKHKETIYILNTHAKVIASKYQIGSGRFYELFKAFVNRLTEWDQGSEASYFLRYPPEVAAACWEFKNCIRTEVTEVDGVGAHN